MRRQYKLKRRGRMFRVQYGGAVPAIAAKAAMVGLKVANVVSKIAKIGATVAQKWPQVLQASTHVARATKHLQPIVKPIQKAFLPVTRAYGRAKAATYGRIIRDPFEKAMAQAGLGGGPMKYSLAAHGVDKGFYNKKYCG